MADKTESHTTFHRIQEAYEGLSNPKKRLEYDQLREQKWARGTSGLANSWSKKNDFTTRGTKTSQKPYTGPFREREPHPGWKAYRGPPPSYTRQNTERRRGFRPHSGGKDEPMAQRNGYTRRARSMEGCVASEIPPMPHNRESPHTPHTSEGSKRVSPQPSGPRKAPAPNDTQQQASPEQNRGPLWGFPFSFRCELRILELGQFRGPINRPTQGSNISTAVPQPSANDFVDHTMGNQVDGKGKQPRRTLRPRSRMRGQQPCVKND